MRGLHAAVVLADVLQHLGKPRGRAG